jgi:hypothetical protein
MRMSILTRNSFRVSYSEFLRVIIYIIIIDIELPTRIMRGGLMYSTTKV